MAKVSQKSLDTRKEIVNVIWSTYREKGMTQAVLAQKMGKKQSWVSYLLSGDAELTLSQIVEFEEALGINLINRKQS